MFIFLSVFSVTWIVLSMLPLLLLLVSTMCATNNFCQAILQSNTDLVQYLPQEQIGQLTDWIHDTSLNQVESKRNVPSLSIVNPLDVLRQKLLLDIARRRMRQAKGQVDANREWLKSIGKRSSQLSDD